MIFSTRRFNTPFILASISNQQHSACLHRKSSVYTLFPITCSPWQSMVMILIHNKSIAVPQPSISAWRGDATTWRSAPKSKHAPPSNRSRVETLNCCPVQQPERQSFCPGPLPREPSTASPTPSCGLAVSMDSVRLTWRDSGASC